MAFSSSTLTEHVIRGVVGFTTLAIALGVADQHPWLALIVALVALVAFRGCPVCWTAGLIETIAYKILRQHE